MTNGAHIREEELQLMALGALPEEETAVVLKHAAECAKCGALLTEERGRAALLAFAATPERPAATVKAELLARIRAEREAEETYRWPSKPEMNSAAPVASGQMHSWRQWAMVPIAAAFLVAAVVEWTENRRLTSELANANHEIVQMTNERQRAEMLVDLLSAPDTTSVKLAAAPETERATGMVRYNPRKGMVVYIAELPPLPADKIYQMWLVPKAGAPISAGIFAPGPHGTRQLWTAEVPTNTEVKAFAVTIEPAGGVPQPTGPKVLIGAS